MKTQTIENTRAASRQREKGQAVVEYAMLLLVLMALLIAMTAVGVHANNLLNWVSSNMN